MLRPLIVLLLAVPAVASAAPTLCVAPGGAGGCHASIQSAIDAAPPGATVQVAPGTYVENVLTAIDRSVTVAGAAAGTTIVDGSGVAPVFVLRGRASVTLSGLTLRNGTTGLSILAGAKTTVTGCVVRDNAATGVVLADRSRLTITDSEVRGNGSDGIVSHGDQRFRNQVDVVRCTVAGNARYGLTAGDTRLRVYDSTIDDNGSTGIVASLLGILSGSTVSRNHLGGIALSGYPGATRIVSSTISGNDKPGGYGGGLYSIRKVRLDHVTVAGNSAAFGGGLYVGPFTQLTASIVADNSAGSGADCSSPFDVKVGGGLAIEDPTGCPLVPLAGASIVTGDPALLPLQDNGGPTETQALDAGSSARGVLTRGASCNRPDQRGVARSVPCDLGAYEAP